MNNLLLKTLIMLVTIALFSSISCFAGDPKPGEKSAPKPFTVQIKDKPMTFCNPLTITGAGRAGEPIVLIFQDDYYLFITGRKGYWFSPNMRDWTYVDSPTFPGGVPGVGTDGKILYGCAMNSKDLYSCTDPKKGVWTKIATMDSDRYGDADIFIDDDGRVYMYFGWSQLLPIQVVELDPKNGFKEKGKPEVCFFGDPQNHGFERRRPEDVIWPIMDYRPYYPEEIPWIEGPWMVKHNGKYYLQYAAIGLEFLSYSHGIYVSDSPMGPFKYSEHNPLTFKTTGFAVGGGHGSTFHDKNGNLWTICMIPSSFGSGRGSSELAMFPTAVDAQGVMHSNTAFGDYPQYYPGIKENNVDDNFTGWMLLSNKKYVETSSTLKGFEPKNAVDENFRTFWSAETGKPGEYLTVDLGKECKVYAVQINLDQKDAKLPAGRGRGFGMTPPANDNKPRQRYTLQISSDNKNWTTVVDKSNNTVEIHHDYAELATPTNARYVKLTNVFTPDSGKFAVKDLRVFGNPEVTKFTKVTDVKVVRNPEDRRDATLLWEPVKGADGYVIRYGIEPKKLYNSYMVYDANTITIHSLNKNPDYYFEVEAFDNGTDYYREKYARTVGVGAEIELSKDGGAQMTTLWGGSVIDRKMVKEGVTEYVFGNLVPGDYVLKHTFGPVLWRGKLTNAELIGAGDKPTVTAVLAKLGVGTTTTGQIEMKIIPGKESGKIIVIFNYNK